MDIYYRACLEQAKRGWLHGSALGAGLSFVGDVGKRLPKESFKSSSAPSASSCINHIWVAVLIGNLRWLRDLCRSLWHFHLQFMQQKISRLPTNHKEKRHVFGNRIFIMHVFLSLNSSQTVVKREHLRLFSFVLNESSEIFRHFNYSCFICWSIPKLVNKRSAPFWQSKEHCPSSCIQGVSGPSIVPSMFWKCQEVDFKVLNAQISHKIKPINTDTDVCQTGGHAAVGLWGLGLLNDWAHLHAECCLLCRCAALALTSPT